MDLNFTFFYIDITGFKDIAELEIWKLDCFNKS